MKKKKRDKELEKIISLSLTTRMFLRFKIDKPLTP